MSSLPTVTGGVTSLNHLRMAGIAILPYFLPTLGDHTVSYEFRAKKGFRCLNARIDLDITGAYTLLFPSKNITYIHVFACLFCPLHRLSNDTIHLTEKAGCLSGFSSKDAGSITGARCVTETGEKRNKDARQWSKLGHGVWRWRWRGCSVSRLSAYQLDRR